MTRAPAKIQVPDIDVIVECERWPDDAEAIVRRALAQAAQAVRAQLAGRVLAVLLTDDAAIRRLNTAWRGVDRPTNVLSFPAPAGRASAPLGDIALAFETTAHEADAEGKPLAHHLAHLAVHGFLHLLGHDHQQDGEAEAMERLEREVLGRLGVPDPYASNQSSSQSARV
jgi:probable rRNA maturation factor